MNLSNLILSCDLQRSGKWKCSWNIIMGYSVYSNRIMAQNYQHNCKLCMNFQGTFSDFTKNVSFYLKIT